MKNPWVFILGCMLSVLAVGCGTTPSSDSGGIEYYPHTNGYSWSYRQVATASSTTDSTTTNTIQTFEGTTTVGSITVQKLKTQTVGYSSSIEALWLINDSYAKQYGTSSSPTTDAITWLSFPLSSGATWAYYGTYETTVAKESVTVPAGTFDCFKITYNTGTTDATLIYWWGKNAGLAKQVVTFKVAGITYTYTTDLTSKNF